MNVLSELKKAFRLALADLVDNPDELLEMIRPAQDPKFGDYQANFAMPLGKRLGKNPREVADLIVGQIDLSGICDQPEVAGPGFINLRLKDEWIVEQLSKMIHDERLGIAPVAQPNTYVIDYSSPNVAKPMHVGHIRSTVIGDALTRTLRFLGHKVISDNHLGDWGTQFGMIIYGYKHFVDSAAYQQSPVAELGRLYRLVHQLVDYHNGKKQVPHLEAKVSETQSKLENLEAIPPADDKSAAKKAKRALGAAQTELSKTRDSLKELLEKLRRVESSDELSKLAADHHDISQAVLDETAKLHAGNEENLRLWNEFLPNCRDEIQRVYSRLDVHFDHEFGESFYHDQLAAVVEDFRRRGLAVESDGAMCVFLEDFDAPMLIQKKDGAYLYATTDLATINYRMEHWHPDVILYVVDHRQSEHFEKLFAVTRITGNDKVELRHITFGTVMGKDGKPYRTRSGDTVGLEGLLDEAVTKAHSVVSENDNSKPNGPELSESERQNIAKVIGHAAIKYADLSHNRVSDYVFDQDKMVAMQGNTASYMQYSYARIQSILAKGDLDLQEIRGSNAKIELKHPFERALAIEFLRFEEALSDTVADFRPNQLTDYLYGVADKFSKFYNECPVLKAETDELRTSRILLCDLAGRTIQQGLALLGIGVVDRM